MRPGERRGTPVGMASLPSQGSVIPRAVEPSGAPAGVSLPDGSPDAALPVRAPGMCGTATATLSLSCAALHQRAGTLEDGLRCFRLQLTQQELLYDEAVNG